MMRTNRRRFMSTALAGGLAATWSRSCGGSEAHNDIVHKRHQPCLELALTTDKIYTFVSLAIFW